MALSYNMNASTHHSGDNKVQWRSDAPFSMQIFHLGSSLSLIDCLSLVRNTNNQYTHNQPFTVPKVEWGEPKEVLPGQVIQLQLSLSTISSLFQWISPLTSGDPVSTLPPFPVVAQTEFKSTIKWKRMGIMKMMRLTSNSLTLTSWWASFLFWLSTRHLNTEITFLFSSILSPSDWCQPPFSNLWKIIVNEPPYSAALEYDQVPESSSLMNSHACHGRLALPPPGDQLSS